MGNNHVKTTGSAPSNALQIKSTDLDVDDVPDDFKNKIVFGHSTRFVIMLLSILCLTLVCANTLALNFTVICMYKPEVEDAIDVSNGTIGVPKRDMMFSLTEKSWLFSAVAIGQIFGTIPISYVTSHYGVRRSFTVYGAISALSTLLTPFCTIYGFYPVFLMRIFQGFAMATSFPSLGAIVTEWSTVKSNGMFIALLSVHLQFGSMLTMPVSGELCASSLGWPAVYYLQGTLTILFFVVFYCFYRNTPVLHKNVSAKELRKISTGKLHISKEGHRVPYRAILTDLPVWGVFVSCFGGAFGFTLMAQFGPTYLNKVLQFDVQKTGFAAAFPYAISAAFKMIAGPFSDRFTLISEKARIIMFNSLAQFPMTLCLLLMTWIPVDHAGYIQVAYTLATAFCGLNAVGVAKSIQMLGQQHCHFILAMNNFIVSGVQLILPQIVAAVTVDNTAQQWSYIFYMVGALVAGTAVFFNFTSEADPRPWTRDSGSFEPTPVMPPKQLKVPLDAPEDGTGKEARIMFKI